MVENGKIKGISALFISAAVLMSGAALPTANAYAAEESLPTPTSAGGHGDEYDGMAYMDVFQVFDSNVRGDKRTIHYQLVAGGVKGSKHEMAQPISKTPMPADAKGTTYEFTLTDSEKKSIAIDMSDAEPGVYEYHLECVEPEQDGYTYMTADGSVETTYVTRIYVTSKGEATTQFCYPDGRKVYDPGWTIKHVVEPEPKKKKEEGDKAPKLGQVAVPLALLLVPAIGIIVVSGRRRKEEEED